MERDADIWLFSYGTLRQPAVQRALFGREPAWTADALPGFVLGALAIADAQVVATSGEAVHPILRRADGAAAVPGAALAITRAELAIADAYEVADYARIQATLASGRRAWVYVDAAEV